MKLYLVLQFQTSQPAHKLAKEMEKSKKTKDNNTDRPKPKKKVVKKVTAVDELTNEEREAVTVVFHQYETGLREGTIFTKVSHIP